MAIQIICPICQKPFSVPPSQVARRRFCSRPCHIAAQKVMAQTCHPFPDAWKGGRQRTVAGYIRLYVPDHPHQDKDHTVFEHRLVAEQTLGRLLEPHEVVHHINRIRDDNRPENLQVLRSSSEHSRLHGYGDKPPNTATERQCCVCHIVKPLTPEFFARHRHSKYGFMYTCRECYNAQRRKLK